MIRKISNISTIKDVAETAGVSTTTVSQPKHQLGETGAKLLLLRIRKGERPKSAMLPGSISGKASKFSDSQKAAMIRKI